MLDCRFRPLEKFPRPFTQRRRDADFAAQWGKTLDDLEKELKHLKAQNIIIRVALGLDDIRNDGWPRSSAIPSHPGIILSFEGKNGAMSMPCDQFTDWRSNVRAIGLTLDYLRRIDRYGVTTVHGEQYSGFKSLPPAPTADQAMTIDAAAVTLCELAHESPQHYKPAVNMAEMELLYKRAAMKCHHDRAGDGGSLSWQRLQAAYAVLKKIYGKA